MRFKWLIGALALSGMLALLEELSLTYYLFWRYPWFDTILHGTGGAAIGTFAVALLAHSYRPGIYLSFVVTAAIGWEVFEYAIGTPQAANFTLDTASDLLFDAIGAIIPYTIARTTIWRSN